jgi:hypothetical protein
MKLMLTTASPSRQTLPMNKMHSPPPLTVTNIFHNFATGLCGVEGNHILRMSFSDPLTFLFEYGKQQWLALTSPTKTRVWKIRLIHRYAARSIDLSLLSQMV